MNKTLLALIVALGGFLMGFDASVIAGVVGAIEIEFGLTKLQLGWAVSSLTLTATLGMMLSGPLSDRIGRKPVLQLAAVLFAVSAVASAIAPDFLTLVIARMVGGLGVGAALIIAPMYIAEMAPPESRGRLVSFNQLNIVIGISAAFFSNYLILSLGESGAPWTEPLRLGELGWRWMLGVEAIPAVIYFLALLPVPESPRWLEMRGRAVPPKVPVSELLQPALKKVLFIGIAVGVLQQITGINSVFFYAPVIFEQAGFGTNAAFMQAVLVGLTNLAFTVVAILMIDRLGRRPLLGFGLFGIAVCMFTLAWAFSGVDEAAADAATVVNANIVLFAILGFVACFAVSLGPVMWVLFSELFPDEVRGLAVSFVGLINSTVSFLVTLVFPWQLDTIGPAATFAAYGGFAAVGLVIVMRVLPETKGRSLEELEQMLVIDSVR
ncbi:MAG: MFS transporter [Pseudomonadota bacterium]